jgi:hypothetical protein
VNPAAGVLALLLTFLAGGVAQTYLPPTEPGPAPVSASSSPWLDPNP